MCDRGEAMMVDKRWSNKEQEENEWLMLRYDSSSGKSEGVRGGAS